MYNVEAIDSGNFIFKIKSRGSEIVTDAKGAGFTPPDLLLAGLASCIGVYVRKYFDGAKISVDGFSVSASADFFKEPPVRFKNISIKISLKDNKLDGRRANALIEFIKNCPVHNTLKNSPDIEIKLE